MKEEHKMILVCVMWGCTAIASFGSFVVGIMMAGATIYLTHHLYGFPI